MPHARKILIVSYQKLIIQTPSYRLESWRLESWVFTRPNGKYQEPGNLTNEGHRYRDPAGFIDGPNDYNYVHHN